MPERTFFYGTLMTGFERRRALALDGLLRFRGRGTIRARLFDLGPFPAAVPAPDSRVRGELFEFDDAGHVLAALDEVEGCEPADPDASLYVRRVVPVLLDDGSNLDAWVYFYNAPLGQAPVIPSGDYLEHLRVR